MDTSRAHGKTEGCPGCPLLKGREEKSGRPGVPRAVHFARRTRTLSATRISSPSTRSPHGTGMLRAVLKPNARDSRPDRLSPLCPPPPLDIRGEDAAGCHEAFPGGEWMLMGCGAHGEISSAQDLFDARSPHARLRLLGPWQSFWPCARRGDQTTWRATISKRTD